MKHEWPSTTLSVEIDAAELAVRMLEAACELKRPCPNAVEALATIDEDQREGWQRAAEAAVDYIIKECLTMGPVQ